MCLPKRFSEDCSWKKKRSQGNVCDENNDKRVNINHPEEAAGFWQLFPFLFCSSLSLPYPLHNSSQIIAVKNSRYRKNIGEIRQYYEVQHQNWYVIDGFHSKWWIWNEVIKKVKMVNKYMQIYMERIKAGKKTYNSENKKMWIWSLRMPDSCCHNSFNLNICSLNQYLMSLSQHFKCILFPSYCGHVHLF